MVRAMKLGAAVCAALISQNAVAQTFPVQLDGRIIEFWNEQSGDVTLRLSVNGPCGSPNFTIQHSTPSFQGMTAAMLTAAASAKTVRLQLSGCNSSYNIVDHGAVLF